MSSSKLETIISGGGIGGLTAAIALRRAGHKVTVYEKSSLSHEVGQGITIAPNGGRILKHLGLDFEKARMVNYIGRNVTNAETLEVTAGAVRLEAMEKAFGLKMMAAYRVDLHAALVELARSVEGKGDAVKIVTQADVVGYDGEKGTVTFASGETRTADLVIAADGVKSSAAAYINGPDCPAVDSSDTIVFRFTLSKEQMHSDPLTAPLLDAGSGMCTFNVSPTADKWLVRYWCRDDGLQNFALYSLRPYEDAEGQDDELRFHTDKQSLLREMEGFHPALRRLAEMTADVLPLWRCTTREPLSKMHKGKMVVIGDAAHPVKPHIGLGAVSAIEDAGVLGALFADMPNKGDPGEFVGQRLELFDKLRVGRVAAYKYFSDVPFFRKPVDEQLENCKKWAKPEALPATQAEFIPWFMGFDAVGNAQRALQEMPQPNGRHL